ncbi:2-C-methyl-D-erythritol 4-phosphate cytidylyltransferase [Spiroplasma helicoides]|uniref:2-C-methyl-D-erythritol 4-phosphate cytidylyltransferase n=1 Tax=Spiroplasma helicoides TaxID=216938 RepID=A0A1B3SJ66_9MOLU|nr:IspD/TarI family cytidylyltransferase [Spiroplasma helicoides]AOG59975.1 2-C-methyl-D-erythritol 4-phosphate cytidylyltransferase [Spiroplasma helicoides]
MIDLVIVAYGKSERFGNNKMLEKIEDDFLINKTLKAFSKISEVSKVIVVTNSKVWDKIDKKMFDKLFFIEGGKTRSQSVNRGLKLVESNFVFIHDGARPFLSKKLINNLIKHKDLNDAVIPYLKITSCLKKIDGDQIQTLNRDDYFISQTPQLFKTNIIKKEYEKLDINWFDDCQALEGKGYKIKLIEGEEQNKKITYKYDINN